MQDWTRGRGPIAAMFAVLALVAGCSGTTSSLDGVRAMMMPARNHGYRASERERECLARAIFFEANRSSRDGMIAVGSVVMNRRDSGKWGDDICDVVGARRQFAPGVLTRPMNSKALPDVMEATDAVLKGERHAKVGKDVMFFHTAGLKFPYKNMHYTTVAGGNAFYFKKDRKQDRLPVEPKFELPEVMVAEAAPARPEPVQAGLPAAAPTATAPEVQVAFAGDTPTARTKRTGLFGRKRVAPVEDVPVAEPLEAVQIVLADAAPIPPERGEVLPAPQPDGVAAAPAAAFESVPETPETPRTKSRKNRKAKPAAGTMTASVYDEAPAPERFGGATVQPSYADAADTGLSFGDGTGTGILGRLVVDGGWQ